MVVNTTLVVFLVLKYFFLNIQLNQTKVVFQNIEYLFKILNNFFLTPTKNLII